MRAGSGVGLGRSFRNCRGLSSHMIPSRLAGGLWPANMLKSVDIWKWRSAAGEADRRGGGVPP